MKQFEVKLPSGELISGLSGQDVVELAKSGRLTGDSMIRQQGQERWYRAKDVAQLATHLRTEFVGIPASLASPSPEPESSPEPIECATQKPAVVRRRSWLVAGVTCTAAAACAAVAVFVWRARPELLGRGNDVASTGTATGSTADSGARDSLQPRQGRGASSTLQASVEVQALFDLALGALTQDQEVGSVEGFKLGMTYKSVAGRFDLTTVISQRLIRGQTLSPPRDYRYEFVFDKRERLVGFSREYFGDTADRIELLADRFGKTDKAISSWRTPSSNRIVEVTHSWWHFRDGVVQAFTTEQSSIVCVWDKDFIREQLAVEVDPRRLVLLDWVSTAFSRLRAGAGLAEISGVPAGYQAETVRQEYGSDGSWSEVMTVEESGEPQDGRYDHPTKAVIECGFERGERSVVVVRLNRTLGNLCDASDPLGSGCALESTLNQMLRPQDPCKGTGTFLEHSTLMSIFEVAITELVVMSRFPPRDGQFTKTSNPAIKRVAGFGSTYLDTDWSGAKYSWSLEGGGTVKITFSGELSVKRQSIK